MDGDSTGVSACFAYTFATMAPEALVLTGAVFAASRTALPSTAASFTSKAQPTGAR